ncbi:MAG: glycosyltransferase family 39 protein [Candidatus Cloacimonetes bacterium]|nr:glycosyltransferase family 39 protein [Candidatus Cloacimonadota bacterium]
MKYKLTIKMKTAIFIVGITLFKILYTMGLNVLTDEAYYFLWSEHLDFSYFDHPPMIAYLFALIRFIFNNKELVVHLVPILLSAGTSIYVFLLGKELFNKKIAFQFVLLTNCTLIMFAGSIIATPDTPMIFFLTGATYYFYLATKKTKNIHWFLTGLFIGLALISKYISVLIYVAFLLYLTLKENRKWLGTVKPYLSLFLSLIIFSPVILWNYFNGWVSFKFQLFHGLGGSFPNFAKFLEFLGGQAAIVTPLLFLLFLFAFIYVLIKWKKVTIEEKYLWIISAVFFIFFLISSLQKKVEANWPAFAYIPNSLLIIALYQQKWKRTNFIKGLWVANWIIMTGILVLILIHIYLPFINIKGDPTDQFFGWDKLGSEVVRLANENDGFKLSANRLQIASELTFYSDKMFVCFNIDSRPNQFSLWQKNNSFMGKNFLFFDKNKHLRKGIKNHFSHIELLKKIPRKRGEKILETFYVYKAKVQNN